MKINYVLKKILIISHNCSDILPGGKLKHQTSGSLHSICLALLQPLATVSEEH